MSTVLATVGTPPVIGTAPSLTSRVPAASRLTTMVLSRSSPMTSGSPSAGRMRADMNWGANRLTRKGIARCPAMGFVTKRERAAPVKDRAGIGPSVKSGLDSTWYDTALDPNQFRTTF